MTLTVRTAPTLARRLVKSTGYIRRELAAASRAEQAGRDGATETRRKLTSIFTDRLREAEQAVEDTLKRAEEFERAVHILCFKQPGAFHPSPVIGAAKRCLALGCANPVLIEKLERAAKHARDAADRAEKRLVDAEADLDATRLHGELLGALPGAGFDTKHPDIKDLRRKYNAAANASRKART
ncbi:hypothetical protein [Shimia aestuarii]|uniref:Uncharacterized protein n=1 Tax=Shimia aestuarii TaxID=254406 RepID=A0A1I4N6W3_9RHOB|nr:hypothetical protein [Shimia aestuarii]SFM11125.1 hypothetical protein SAMN04488042_10413 [Shimia aestuarii]